MTPWLLMLLGGLIGLALRGLPGLIVGLIAGAALAYAIGQAARRIQGGIVPPAAKSAIVSRMMADYEDVVRTAYPALSPDQRRVKLAACVEEIAHRAAFRASSPSAVWRADVVLPAAYALAQEQSADELQRSFYMLALIIQQQWYLTDEQRATLQYQSTKRTVDSSTKDAGQTAQRASESVSSPSVRPRQVAPDAQSIARVLFESAMAVLDRVKPQARAIAADSYVSVDVVESEQFFITMAGVVIGLREIITLPRRERIEAELLQLAGTMFSGEHSAELRAALHERITIYNDIVVGASAEDAARQAGHQFTAMVNSLNMGVAAHASHLFTQAKALPHQIALGGAV